MLSAVFPNFESFVASQVGIDAEVVGGLVVTRIAYDGVTRFARGTSAYSLTAVEAVIEAADLDYFREHYTSRATPVGSSIFATTELVLMSSDTDTTTADTIAAQSQVGASRTMNRGSSEMLPRHSIFRHATTASSDAGSGSE